MKKNDKGCNKISANYSCVCFYLYTTPHGSTYVKFTTFQYHDI